MTKLGIIGGGVMGEALLSRLLARGVYQPTEVRVSEPNAQRREVLAAQYGVQVTAENREAAAAPVLLLAIKPQIFAAVTSELADGSMSLIVSILAGVPLNKLEEAFPGKAAIRAMPNTPATVGQGMTAIAANAQTSPEQLAQAKAIFQAVGEVVEVPEYQMDAVTGLSGSGPGYIAILIEALTDGGVYAGLPRAIAAQLALQTVLGTAQLIRETGWHPAELKDRVTSPGGTTIAGIAQLERSGFRSALIEAVKAAEGRSRELGS
ncbi:pyrroline-5-carboxylate reductase [Desertifilum sp. FACHB-1129]|uniref:Pyrroline-5-carboxylate reductase n=1 Tax=Desertifilum tharense IPPAS B-1220 TaxID=1781255 RepID=A0A1E5QED9_9CYAN|nr:MULTISPECIES: pyrroline-5-carboxylate reductase [Desertifilum]MDA0211519.1 pyrroline-5-carboxylate reductase [Cyanobacteria bacterium FC1]MBD2315031.1 pyrroline-5-carboxylate reductase [Desertifilum sp. FACHB-1129]MBD2324705.1 pyrroline-5-carboxylate reductase [Desertifilum sp. FACHB-866]MBD2334739.1 pyrroline-5-carboxylate reductase [Desertifilum sp. FACHB-868]OEJ72997.1 pyrroline-5-carboxylate reductase [Desertifilum tharense IPPAS B-1220]